MWLINKIKIPLSNMNDSEFTEADYYYDKTRRQQLLSPQPTTNSVCIQANHSLRLNLLKDDLIKRQRFSSPWFSFIPQTCHHTTINNNIKKTDNKRKLVDKASKRIKQINSKPNLTIILHDKEYKCYESLFNYFGVIWVKIWDQFLTFIEL